MVAGGIIYGNIGGELQQHQHGTAAAQQQRVSDTKTISLEVEGRICYTAETGVALVTVG